MVMLAVQDGPQPIPVPEIIDPAAPESIDDPDMSTLDGGKREEQNLFEKLTGGEFDFKLPQLNLDKLCASSDSVVKEDELEKAPDAEATEASTDEKKFFTDEQVEEMKAKLKEGWAFTTATAIKLTDTAKEKWADYQEKKNAEAAKEETEDAAPADEPPMPTEVTIQPV